MNIILLGPPGAGKGTQARFLVETRHMTQLSTGDLLRGAKESGSEIGERVAGVIARGDLVTDEIVIDLIRDNLIKSDGKGFVFDGFPRTLAQADALGSLLEEVGQNLHAVIELRVDDDALIRRILARTTCGSCGEVFNSETKPVPENGECPKCGAIKMSKRADDNLESLKQRLGEYYKKTSPLIGYYHAKSLLSPIDGLADISEIQSEIASVLNK